MRHPLLLDTCAVLWIAEDALISERAAAALNEAYADGVPVYVSPISAWEIGLLFSRGKISSIYPPAKWFSMFMATPGIALAGMPPEVLIGSSHLPGNIHRDPADRIIAATAREYGYTVLTRDRALLTYADEGHLSVLAC